MDWADCSTLRYVMFMFYVRHDSLLTCDLCVNVLVNVVFVVKVVVKVHVSAPDTKDMKTKSRHMWSKLCLMTDLRVSFHGLWPRGLLHSFVFPSSVRLLRRLHRRFLWPFAFSIVFSIRRLRRWLLRPFVRLRRLLRSSSPSVRLTRLLCRLLGPLRSVLCPLW